MAMYALLHNLVYPGSYRHQGLFLMFLVALYWIAARGQGGAWPKWTAQREGWLRTGSAIGGASFQLLLAVQLLHTASSVSAASQGVPYSQAKEVGALLEREGLTDAVLIADSDPVIEALAYYTPAQAYILRDQRFGKVVRLTRASRLHISLDDILGEARRLRRETYQPVVILTQHRLDPAAAPQEVKHMFGTGTYAIDPDQVRRFLAATRRIAEMRPALTAESYDVYALRE
jgi:hypothetical protein